MGITSQGIEGEKELFGFLKSRGHKFFQPDSIALVNNQYYVIEMKKQEWFKAPPFDGHGLPRWQVTARLEFEERTKVIALLMIHDIETSELFCQLLSVLEKGEKYDTRGLKPRRIYPISSFKQLK